MSLVAQIVEGRNSELGPFTLQTVAVDGTVGVFNLTGYTGRVSLVAIPYGATAPHPMLGTVRLGTPLTGGTVYYTPDPSDFEALKSPYSVRWRVDGDDGNPIYFPDGEPDTIEVRL